MQQVAVSCSSLRKLYKLKVVSIFGGSDRAAQAHSLAGSPDILVATPGRLVDLTAAHEGLLGEPSHAVTLLCSESACRHKISCKGYAMLRYSQ